MVPLRPFIHLPDHRHEETSPRGSHEVFPQAIPACLVGMEACATAHYWAREISALGHRVRLMPPSYVKAHLRRQKNDAADAQAICEAVTRPTMRLVPVKTAGRQACWFFTGPANCWCGSGPC